MFIARMMSLIKKIGPHCSRGGCWNELLQGDPDTIIGCSRLIESIVDEKDTDEDKLNWKIWKE